MASTRRSIVLFGDSLTQQSFGTGGSSWGARVAELYQRRATVYNRGFSGYTTRWALPLLRPALADVCGAPALLTICFGANDAALPDGGGAVQHVPPCVHDAIRDEHPRRVHPRRPGAQECAEPAQVVGTSP